MRLIIEDIALKLLKDIGISKAVGRGGSRAAATSKMECFVTIVNGWKLLTIITKYSILDVAAALDHLWQVLIIFWKIFKGCCNHFRKTRNQNRLFSIKLGIFPDPYKLANISKWFQNESSPPPQLLPLISKIFEKIVHDQIVDYLVQYVILYKY